MRAKPPHAIPRHPTGRVQRSHRGLAGRPTAYRPNLTDAQLAELRAMLEEQREFRLDQLAALRRPQSRHRLGAGNREISVVLTVGAENALHEVEAALQRMADGSYGRCVHCGGGIDVERLEILPQTPVCMGCQDVKP
jgi:RNA polymerase-binding transcription factor DksA